MAKESKTIDVSFICDNGYTQARKEITIKYSDLKDLMTKIRMYKKSGILVPTDEPGKQEYMSEEFIVRIIVNL